MNSPGHIVSAYERRHAGAEIPVLVGLAHTLEGAVGGLGIVGERPRPPRFVGHDGVDVVGVRRHPGEGSDRTAAAAEHVDLALTQMVCECVQVGGLVLRRLVVAAVPADAAAAEPRGS